MTTSRILLSILLVLAGIFAISVTFFYPSPTPQTAQQNTKALIGGPFTLIDHHGKTVTDKSFSGKYMLIYFGYTYCPDVCPTELQIMSDALDQVSKKTLKAITPIFITVDPIRDTVDIMAQYVPAFHEDMVGLTGSEEQVKSAKKSYRAYGAKEKQAEGADPEAYLVNHTSYIYLMDPKGTYVTHFRSQTDPEMMAKRLEDVIG